MKRHASAALEPTRPRQPFSVERLPSTSDTVLLVAYDGAGMPAAELRVPSHRYDIAQVDRLRLLVKAMPCITRPANPSRLATLGVIRGGVQ